jgi:GTPase SAR1 family protein
VLLDGCHGQVTTMPTLSFNAEVVDYKRARFGMWDVGGQDNLRVFWRHHYTGTQVTNWHSAH